MYESRAWLRTLSSRFANTRVGAPMARKHNESGEVEEVASAGPPPVDAIATQPVGPATRESEPAATLLSSSVGRLATLGHNLLVGLVTCYIVWVLMGTCAWVSHLGARVAVLGPFLPGYGAPGTKIPSASGVPGFLAANVPMAAVFVIPHSVLLPHRMRAWVGARYGRLAYSLHSALSLHFLLSNFTPLAAPVVMELPLPRLWHNTLSVSCLAYALVAFAAHDATWQLLGTRDALGGSRAGRRAPPKMDAITWMGMTVWEQGGGLAFVLFTGLSILPAELTLGDAMTRACAAVYLRLRSKGFRDWVARIESAHLMTWGLRALLMVGWMQTAKGGGWHSFAGGCALALLLRVVEGSSGGDGKRRVDTAHGASPPPTPPE